MLARLVSNSWPQVILLPRPPTVLGFQAWAPKPSWNWLLWNEAKVFGKARALGTTNSGLKSSQCWGQAPKGQGATKTWYVEFLNPYLFSFLGVIPISVCTTRYFFSKSFLWHYWELYFSKCIYRTRSALLGASIETQNLRPCSKAYWIRMFYFNKIARRF